jgi:deazaflavin-dependent oxidoreductase (nitroreductase family)
MITQLGRRSGKVRRTVVEVLRHDPVTGEFIVVAGYGRTSDWYRNIRATPALEVQVGGRRFTPTQRFLPAAEVYKELESYSDRHSRLAHRIYPVFARMIGLNYVGSEAERSTLTTELPMVALRPR